MRLTYGQSSLFTFCVNFVMHLKVFQPIILTFYGDSLDHGYLKYFSAKYELYLVLLY